MKLKYVRAPSLMNVPILNTTRAIDGIENNIVEKTNARNEIHERPKKYPITPGGTSILVVLTLYSSTAGMFKLPIVFP